MTGPCRVGGREARADKGRKYVRRSLRRAYAAYAVMMKYNRKGEENEKEK